MELGYAVLGKQTDEVQATNGVFSFGGREARTK